MSSRNHKGPSIVVAQIMPVFDEKTRQILEGFGVEIILGNEIVHRHYPIGPRKLQSKIGAITEVLAQHHGMLLDANRHDNSVHRLDDVRRQIDGCDIIAYRWQNGDISPLLRLDLDLILNAGSSVQSITPTGGYGLSWVRLKIKKGYAITADELAVILERNVIKVIRRGKNMPDNIKKQEGGDNSEE